MKFPSATHKAKPEAPSARGRKSRVDHPTLAPEWERAYHIARVTLYALVLLYAAAAGLRTVGDPDMGWHLATGRWVVQHHAIPSTDVLSYTTPGRQWIYPPFAGVLLYLVFTVAGYAGLSIFCALACVLTIAYLTRRRDFVSLSLAFLAVGPIALRTGPRADLFSTVFLALFLGELWAFQHGETKRLWPLPLIMLLWVNFHPGFILGLAVIAAYLLLEILDLLFAERRARVRERLRQAAPWLLATLLATFVNPWGPKLYRTSLALAGVIPQPDASSGRIFELLPVRITPSLLREMIDLRGYENGWIWLMALSCLVLLLALWRKQLGAALIQGVALYFAIHHVRYIGLLCVVTVIVGASVLGEVVRPRFRREDRGKSAPEEGPLVTVHPFIALMCVCALGALTVLRTVDLITNRSHVVNSTGVSFGAGAAHWLPERAASFIRREGLPGNIFQEYGAGGFAAWRLGPEYPTFSDGRFGAMLQQEQRILAQPADSDLWQSAADRWGINVLMFAEGGGRAMEHLNARDFCRSANWRPVYMDEVSLVLLRNTPANRPWLDRLQIDCLEQSLVPPQHASRKQLYDFWSDAGTLFFALERDDQAEDALRRAAALYPQDGFVRMVLGQLYYQHQLYDKAEQEFRASLALHENTATWYVLGQLLIGQRRLPEAEPALARSADSSPTPHQIYLELGELELWLQRPNAALKALDDAESTSPFRNDARRSAATFHARIASTRAEAYRMLSRLPEAVEQQKESVRLTPADTTRWNKLADLLASSGQNEAAQQARQRALELQSTPAKD